MSEKQRREAKPIGRLAQRERQVRPSDVSFDHLVGTREERGDVSRSPSHLIVTAVDPVARWQNRQWQIVTRIGSERVSYLTAPQRHPPECTVITSPFQPGCTMPQCRTAASLDYLVGARKERGW